MTASKQSDNSCLRLRIQPNASRNEVIGFSDNMLLVKIAAPPVKGKANRELIAFLSQLLDVNKSSISLIKGHTSRNKTISIEGLSQQEIIDRLNI